MKEQLNRFHLNCHTLGFQITDVNIGTTFQWSLGVKGFLLKILCYVSANFTLSTDLTFDESRLPGHTYELV